LVVCTLGTAEGVPTNTLTLKSVKALKKGWGTKMSYLWRLLRVLLYSEEVHQSL